MISILGTENMATVDVEHGTRVTIDKEMSKVRYVEAHCSHALIRMCMRGVCMVCVQESTLIIQ